MYSGLCTALLVAIAGVFSTLFLYQTRKAKRLGKIERSRLIDCFETAALCATVLAAGSGLAGACSSLAYVYKNRELQVFQQQDTAKAQNDSQRALTELVPVKRESLSLTKELIDVRSELKSSYDQLASAKLRLQDIENQQKWRNITAAQERRMNSMLATFAQYRIRPFKRRRIEIISFAGNPEVQSFARRLTSVFKGAGWDARDQETQAYLEDGPAIFPGIRVYAKSAEDERELFQAVKLSLSIVSSEVKFMFNPKAEEAPNITVVVGNKPAPLK